jgi:hypothetical protein
LATTITAAELLTRIQQLRRESEELLAETEPSSPLEPAVRPTLTVIRGGRDEAPGAQ